jgi:hypothetical protein
VKLNLGCGHKKLDGYINVDVCLDPAPDLWWDLELFPWPWQDNSIEEIVMSHVLEHLGQSPKVFLKIICELYRVMEPGALLKIDVPHPRSDNFLADPTHVRPILPMTMAAFSKERCKNLLEIGAATTPLALQHDVDFEFTDVSYTLMTGVTGSNQEIEMAIETKWNIVNAIHMTLKKVT